MFDDEATKLAQALFADPVRAQRHHEVFLAMLKQIVYVSAPLQHRKPDSQAELVQYARDIADLAYPKP